MSEIAGYGKLLNSGGQLLMGFANQLVFNFVGKNPIQPTVQSSLPLSFRAAVPAWRRAGRDPGSADAGRAQPGLSGSYLRQVPPGIHRRYVDGRYDPASPVSDLRFPASRREATTTRPSASSRSCRTWSRWISTAGTSPTSSSLRTFTSSSSRVNRRVCRGSRSIRFARA